MGLGSGVPIEEKLVLGDDRALRGFKPSARSVEVVGDLSLAESFSRHLRPMTSFVKGIDKLPRNVVHE